MLFNSYLMTLIYLFQVSINCDSGSRPIRQVNRGSLKYPSKLLRTVLVLFAEHERSPNPFVVCTQWAIRDIKEESPVVAPPPQVSPFSGDWYPKWEQLSRRGNLPEEWRQGKDHLVWRSSDELQRTNKIQQTGVSVFSRRGSAFLHPDP